MKTFKRQAEEASKKTAGSKLKGTSQKHFKKEVVDKGKVE